MVDVFRKFQLDEPGTHVSQVKIICSCIFFSRFMRVNQVGVQMEAIMRHGRVSGEKRFFVLSL